MDDYLAKPVRGKSLETMLLKWAREGQNKSRFDRHRAHHHDDISCTDDSGLSAPSSEDNELVRDMDAGTALPGMESEGDRGMQRVEAEEKATSLRDNKLIAASHSNPYQMTTSPSGSSHRLEPPPPPAALTEENMTLLDREHGQEFNTSTADYPHHRLGNRLLRPAGKAVAEDEGEGDSLAVHSRNSSQSQQSTVGSLHKLDSRGTSGGAMGLSTRGKLTRVESDRTVTRGDYHAGDRQPS